MNQRVGIIAALVVAASTATAVDRPLRVESTELNGRVEGEVRALVEQPFARVSALADPAHQCEVLTLLPNIRSCRAAEDGRQLTVWFAQRFDQPLADTREVRLDARSGTTADGALEIVLGAKEGPLGTSDYRLEMNAAPAGENGVRLRVRYGYAYGLKVRLATAAYFATRGRDKVGFTVVGTDADGEPEYIGGLRGAIERHAMRLYLAIDAYLDALDAPAGTRRDRSLRSWLDGIARHPRQLAEADPAAYFEAKRARV